MEEVTLLLYFAEENYGRRFLRFLSGKKNPRIHLELVTEKEKVLRRVGTPLKRLVVVTDDDTVYEDGKREVVLLAGEQNLREKKIFQFQRAEEIYKELIALLGIEKGPTQDKGEEKAWGIVTIFSPEGTPVTEMAVLLSQYLGRQGRCLYLSLSGFPVYYGGEFQKEPDYQVPGLGDLLLCPAQEMFADKLKQLVQPFGSADMLAPFSHFKDLLDCTQEDWRLLLSRLREEGGYDSVVVETGALFETLLDLLELSDQLFLVYREDAFGKVRADVFRHYCRMERRERLLSQTEFVRVPEDTEEWRRNLGLYPLGEWADNSQVMGKMEGIFKNRKEEDDVCLWEDFG